MMRYLLAGLVLLAGAAYGQVPEEPVLIEAELEFWGGEVFTCLFQGDVRIDGGLVIVSGCPGGQIICGTLESAEINGFAPYVRASGCVWAGVYSDGFESK